MSSSCSLCKQKQLLFCHCTIQHMFKSTWVRFNQSYIKASWEDAQCCKHFTSLNKEKRLLRTIVRKYCLWCWTLSYFFVEFRKKWSLSRKTRSITFHYIYLDGKANYHCSTVRNKMLWNFLLPSFYMCSTTK